ncbi:MAG: hypothetical protein A4E55_01857 [Pelotomaculum sp. PtaU1.Bin035]|nr:MAG: hypothetical protein A4E55_01857 [Pelotomaculum sp. PtaU1.Bin035]
MTVMAFENMALFEHRFWLQILGDHARFIFSNLSPKEVSAIQIANNFINVFDQLLLRARQPLTGTNLDALTQQAYNQAKDFRDFKLDLLRQHLVEKIQIHLTPTFINHMVNELEEYLRILECLLNKQQPLITNPVHLHLLWLLDAEGHAFYLASGLDEIEKQFIMRSVDFNKLFADLYAKAREMMGYLRTGLNNFPSLVMLNTQAESTTQLFSAFLLDLQQLIIEKRVLSVLVPLATDHMLREECYYLTKLSMVTEYTASRLRSD